jgi:hypothetical protein
MNTVIGCDSFLSLRNVRNGDFGRRLGQGHVRVLVDPNQYRGSKAVCPTGVELGELLEFDAHADRELSQLIQSSYYTRKCYYDPESTWIKLKASSYRDRTGVLRLASLAKARYRLATHWIAGRFGLAQERRRKVVQALRAHPVSLEYRRLLRAWSADVVVGLSPEGIREMVLLEAANQEGIPTAVMIRSRDNLASKIQHLPEANLYFVWSEAARRYMRHLYPEIPADRIQVTGSPQFDRHLDPSFRIGRDQFFELIGLDSTRPLIVFTMSTPRPNDREVDIAQHLADAAHAGKFSSGAQLLVRGHPRVFGSDYRLLHEEYPEARAYPRPTTIPYKSIEHEALVVRTILEDEPVHLATLAYQDVQVNVCGTMTIDSAILDKPTVNVYYDIPRDVPAGESLRRFYKRADVKQMMSYQASRLAHDPDECISLVNRYLDEPSLDSEGRRRAHESECGLMDGSAGRRIADGIKNLHLGSSRV